MGTHGQSTFEQVVKFGVPVLAIVLVLGFSPRFGPKKLGVDKYGQGQYHWLGTDWTMFGPTGHPVVAKRHSPEHYVGGKTEHVLGLGPSYEWSLINESWEVTLEGYGPVPVSAACYDKIKIGDVWNRQWNGTCK